MRPKEKQKSKSAWTKQVNGNHYARFAIQPAEFIYKNNLNWFEGNAIKYICRHRVKGGRVDVEKAIHYLELLLETYRDFKNRRSVDSSNVKHLARFGKRRSNKRHEAGDGCRSR